MMNQIKVELINYMGEDLTVSNVARVSFDKWKESFDSKDEKLVSYLAEHAHFLPFRHAQIQVRCSAPIWLARQLGKHQVGFSWSEVSRRYVDTPMELFNQEFRARPDGGIKQGSGGVVEASSVPCVTVEDLHGGVTGVDIQDLMKGLTDWYEEAIKAGLAPETVRGFMPQNMMTTWIWTGSLLGFYHIYKLRSDSHAQLEAQWFAEKLKEVIEPNFPVAWKALQDAE